ncbi:MAG TPA: YdeI/OmpD-associated family protein [Vicinamibacterales bacterium]
MKHPVARFFKSQKDFRTWLGKRHDAVDELWVGFFRKSSGKPGLAYLDAVDEALCFGWIDGLKKKIDDERYMHRFTPRTAASTWSVVNTRRFGQLTAEGRVAMPGREVFAKRDQRKTGRYSYERAHAAFDRSLETAFRADAKAWAFFCAQPPGYRKLLTYWVTSAKQDETRTRRLNRLMAQSAEGKRIR